MSLDATGFMIGKLLFIIMYTSYDRLQIAVILMDNLITVMDYIMFIAKSSYN
jgi:hypothetical protein